MYIRKVTMRGVVFCSPVEYRCSVEGCTAIMPGPLHTGLQRSAKEALVLSGLPLAEGWTIAETDLNCLMILLCPEHGRLFDGVVCGDDVFAVAHGKTGSA